MDKRKQGMIVVTEYAEAAFTLAELCDICGLSFDDVAHLTEYDIIHPKNISLHERRFNLKELHRIKTALRLQRDLELNLAGIAVVLDLLEELEELRGQMELIERHYL